MTLGLIGKHRNKTVKVTAAQKTERWGRPICSSSLGVQNPAQEFYSPEQKVTGKLITGTTRKAKSIQVVDYAPVGKGCGNGARIVAPSRGSERYYRAAMIRAAKLLCQK